MLRTKMVLAAAGAAAAMFALTGCNKENKTDQSGSSGSMSGSSGSSGRTYGMNESGGSRVSTDTSFLRDAAMGGKAEVELSRIALQNSTRQDVRDLAQQMITDHSNANQKVMQLAQEMGVTLPSQPDTRHRQLADRLMNMRGGDFDQLYLQQMLQDHQETIAKFEHETQAGTDQQVKQFAEQTLPTLRHHLQMVQDTMSGQGGMGGMSHDMSGMHRPDTGAKPTEQPSNAMPPSNPPTNPR